MAGQGLCGKFARFFFVVFNVLFVLFGIAVIAVGTYVKVDSDLKDVQKLIEIDSDDKFLSTASSILIGFGVLVLFIGVLGCLGGIKRNKCILGLYIIFVAIIFIGELSGGIVAGVYKDKISDTLKNTLTDTLVKYKPDKPKDIVTTAWNGVQELLSCCGVNDFKDYQTNGINFTEPYQKVPESCCAKGSNHTICFLESTTPPMVFTALHNKGCYNEFEDLLKSHLSLVIGVAIGIAFFPLFGIFLACVTCRKDGYNKPS